MRRTTLIITALLGSSLFLSACSGPGGGAMSTTGGVDASQRGDENKALVLDFYDQAFNQKELEKAAEMYLDSSYVQHNPGVDDGIDGFVAGMGGLLKQYPELRTEPIRSLAQGELVGVQSRMVLSPGGPEQAVMDIFKVNSGKIVEHWDAVQDVPKTSANGHTMFDGAVAMETRGENVLTRNTEAATDFLNLSFNRAEAQAAVERHVADEYTQHNPFVADGGTAFVEAFAGADAKSGDLLTKFPRTIAEGDFVMVQTFEPRGSAGPDSGSIDIFRFNEEGRIVEHWDAVQEYPKKTASGNTVWDDGR